MDGHHLLRNLLKTVLLSFWGVSNAPLNYPAIEVCSQTLGPEECYRFFHNLFVEFFLNFLMSTKSPSQSGSYSQKEKRTHSLLGKSNS